MLPYLIAGAIGYGIAKLFEEDEAPKYADGGLMLGEYNDLIDLAKESDYNDFLDETDELSKYYILYRGMDSWDEWTNDSFFGNFLSHAKGYGEYVDGIIVDDSDSEIIYFDNYTFNQLRKNITNIILPSFPIDFEGHNEYRQDFVEKLKEIYKPYFDEGKLSDAMMYLNYDEDDVINFVFNFVFNYTENFEEYYDKKDKDFLVPLLTYYAKNKGYNIISFYASDFGGSDEFIVNDISKYTTLSDIWKSVDGNNPDELFNSSDDYAIGGSVSTPKNVQIKIFDEQETYFSSAIKNQKNNDVWMFTKTNKSKATENYETTNIFQYKNYDSMLNSAKRIANDKSTITIYDEQGKGKKYLLKDYFNNPDIHFDGGGSVNELYQDLINGYELLIEIETDKKKIKLYEEIIEGYNIILELQEEVIQEEMNEEVVQDDFTPSYLMTLDEYKAEVTPLIQEYKKFLRKNSNYFVSPEYSGIAQYSLQEALELKDSPNAVFLGSYGRKMSTEKQVRYNYSYKKTRDFKDNYTEPLVPQKLVDENKEFIKKLQKYFTVQELNKKVQDDETKSNKRAIRRAVDEGIYKNLLSNEKVELSKLEEVSNSVGIRLPKSVFDISTQNQMKYEAELGKLLSNIPILSFQKLKELIEQIKVDLIPLQELVYEQEYEHYTQIIQENIGATKKAESFGVELPIWNLIYNYKSEYRKENSNVKNWKGEYLKESVLYVEFTGLVSDWEKQLSMFTKRYVASLKDSIILAIMQNFQSINIPIKSIERLSIEVGKKGFEGSYKFNFENGSSFIMNFQGIGAGGYRIQKYHFRFLTNFSDVKLADGSKGGTNYYDIAKNFSVK